MAGQKLYRNEGMRFTEVTKMAGINGSKIGYGLGVAVSDINLDGWPDIYVGNDFHENDYLYINQQNGTFKEENTQRLMHTSQFSMGVDIADINNDAYPEIISMDMLPYEPYMLRRSLSEDDYNIFQNKINYGYTYQYSRNNLQYNRKNGKFSEVGQYAGIHATDWSWASLWMDFNNDGNKDLFISNGIPKRMNDIDYINFVSGDELQQKLKSNSLQDKDLSLLNKFPEIKIPNQFFLNEGNLRFKNLTDSIKDNPLTFSNGAVYADLDNDGDLDIVVNNINDPVMVYENNTNSTKTKSDFTSIKLVGPKLNNNAIGAKIWLFQNKKVSTYEMQTVHGFQSSMLAPIHIGLANIQTDSVVLIWPDNSYQKINLVVGKQQSVQYKKGLPQFNYIGFAQKQNNALSAKLEDITKESGLQFKHQENLFNEFDRESLMPHMVSTEGPALAVADINHDGLDDIFIGAAKTFHNGVFLQNQSGKFTQLKQPALLLDSMWENVDAIWVDVNNDTHKDLVISSGGNEYYGEDAHLNPLLYINDGKGTLTKKENAFKSVYTTQSKVIANDFNGDGFIDLFIAGRAIPWQYGKPPRSYLLQNDGKGNFVDVTASIAKELLEPGMVTDAKWIDINGDEQKDLLLCYEWGGADAFLKTGKTFTKKIMTNKKGWWQFMLPVDIDNDGDLDLVLGNYGLNSRLKASPEHTVTLYVNDFDDNGSIEQVMTYYVGNKEIPFASKIQLEKRMPFLKKKFLYAADFAKANMVDLFGQKKLNQSLKLQVDCFENLVLINDGKMNFNSKPLPFEAQLSTFRTATIIQSNKNTLPNLFIAGNFYANNIELGRQDADFGLLLENKGKGSFKPSLVNSKPITGEIRNIQPIRVKNKNAFLLAKNNDSIQLITIQ
jgi:hypothetical protein